MEWHGETRRGVQKKGLVSGILMLPVLLGVLFLINSTVQKVDALFVATDLFFAGFLVGDIFVIVRAAKELGLIGRRERD